MPSSLANFFSAFTRTGVQLTVSVVPIPGLGPVSDLLLGIIELCDKIPQNRHVLNAAHHLAERCHYLCKALGQYETAPLPNRTVQYQTAVFECLKEVEHTMREWSKRKWHYLLVHQGDLEADFHVCDTKILDCFLTFMTASQMETLARQREDDEWRTSLKRSLDADRKVIMELLAAPNLVQWVKESKLTSYDQKEISAMIQSSLAERNAISEGEHHRMAKNLYDLLQLSNQLPPNCQLDSRMVEWAGEAPFAGDRNAEMYEGRYLRSQDVRIKVIRSRIRREVELWSKIHNTDQGKHIIPFCGFYSPDGVRLALVSPWISNGDALAYVERHDNLLNYRKLILGVAEGIKVLHSMNPPVIHGNLRARKILIGDASQPLITDFALAKLEGNLITQTSGESDSCRWSAPEMFEDGATVSAKSDIYSFGMTVLELFTHRVPYADIKKNIQVIKKKEKPDGIPNWPQDGQAIGRGLDNRMWGLLCLCWSKNPQDRPSIDELVMQL
ncbi:kinase-like domain-containing protein [Amanita rubescens]|nr:kinase-like domain-containing protein [Amanita rubescens]